VIRYLADRPDAVVSRFDIEQDIWELSPNATTDAVPVAMRRLRAKIEADPSTPVHLQTVHGIGWRFHLGTPKRIEPAPHITLGNLPELGATFMGRAPELLALGTVTNRQFTVTGPPGVGKSWLVQHWAHQQTVAFREIWWIDLAADSDMGLDERVATVLNLRQASEDALTTALKDRGAVLLVLDGADNIAVPRSWLKSCENLQIAITKRKKASGKHIPLGPMDVADGVALLTQRMNDLAATVPKESDLIDLVYAADGLPMALELCASQSRILTSAQLAKRIRERPLGPVREAFEWSWSQLTQAHQSFLISACTFSGEFNLEAAEYIAPHNTDIIDLIADLSDRSMLQIHPDGPRFSIVHGVRRLSQSRLTQSHRDRHVAWVLQWGADAQRDLSKASCIDALRTLRTRQDDLDSARRHAQGADRARLSLIQSAYLHYGGNPQRRLRILLELTDDLPAQLLGEVLGERGHVQTVLGNLQEAESDLNRAMELLPNAKTHRYLSFLRLRLGHDDAARKVIEAGLALNDANADATATLYGDLGLVLYRTKHHAEAEAAFRKGLAMFQLAGNTLREAWLRLFLADQHYFRNNLDEAEAELLRTLELQKTNGSETYQGNLETMLGGVCMQQKRTPEALTWLNLAIPRLRRLGENAYLNVALCTLSDLYLDCERYDDAVLASSEAEMLSRQSGLRRYRALTLLTQANAYRIADAPQLATRCLEQIGDLNTDNRAMGYATAFLCALAADRGDLVAAQEYADSLDGFRKLGDANFDAAAALSKAHLSWVLGDYESVPQALAIAEEVRHESLDIRVCITLLERRMKRP